MRRFAFYIASAAIIATLGAALVLGRSTESGPTALEAAKRLRTTTMPVPAEGPQDPFVLRDVGGELALTVQLSTGRPDTGEFRFDNPKIGTYQGVASVEARPDGRYRVSGVDPEGSFISTTPGVPLAKAQLRVKGTFEPSTSRAVAKVWVGPPDQPMPCGTRDDQDDDLDDQTADKDPDRDTCQATITRYRLRSGDPSKAAAERAAKKTGQLMTAKRWDELHAMLSKAVQAGITAEEFSANMAASQPFRRIVRSTDAAGGSLKSTGGVSYFAQPVTLEVENHDGSTGRFATTLLYVFEEGEWRFASNTPPEPSSSTSTSWTKPIRHCASSGDRTRRPHRPRPH